MTGTEKCTWCGAAVEMGEGFRAYEPAGDRRAVFCRLEHVVPWAMQDAHWDAGTLTEDGGIDDEVSRCSFCEAELGDVHVLLVSHRGDFRIPDGFCSVDHLAQWAKEGGRWR
ncbi:MAG TPA: hypothetical protein VFN15_00745 [Solirubrobacterales bacterium]|nr:hypothetical protein [Solirubrobacterales bacterium]